MNGAIALVVIGVGSAASGGCIAIVAHAVVAPRLHASWVRRRLSVPFTRGRARGAGRLDLADLLDTVARSVRAGSSVPAALVASAPDSARLTPWLDDYIRRCRLGAAPIGQQPASAARDGEGRIAHRALVLSGASRHGPLEHGASLIRLERSLRAERRAAVAPVRASVRILTLAPIAILAWLLARSPEVRMSIAGSPAGLGAVLAGAALNVAGRSWMGRIVSGAVQ